jgi:predicted unusual protein kinase regulating ubiquinone biosynthesis (AarF/ABC1/UbiB family)
VRRPWSVQLNGHKQDDLPEIASSRPRLKVVRGDRPRRVREAVAAAFARQSATISRNSTRIKVGDDWDGAGRRTPLYVPDDLLDTPSSPSDHVVHSMGRRQQVELYSGTDRSYLPPGMQLSTRPKVGPWQVFRRLMVWFQAILSFQFGNWYDAIQHQNSEDRRAVRLRQTFERVGGTFVKIGQQMASRLDLLPQRYCEELASMLDRYPPFPTEQAIAIIARTTGKRLEDIFSEFDPEPIGSASIAVVYQARLRKNGLRVAVKVRRPGIRELFEADFRALDFLGTLAEALTLVRPGYTVNIRSEFRNVLTSELDFRREGRLGDLFRNRTRKAGKRHVTAPEVYFEYSNDEVLVQEFVSGIWLWEILSAVEHSDAGAWARMRELNIDPKVVARRLLQTHYWSLYSHLAFHADPHPANIVVQANNDLVFIDFGATGSINNMRKALFRRSYQSFITGDAATMAQNALLLSEPLPPVDVNMVMKETELAYYNHMIAVKSKHTPWYERTSATMFIESIKILAKHQIPAVPDILMFARATLLYDTLAARLDPSINFYKEHERYALKESKLAKKRARKAIDRRLRSGLQGSDYELLEQALTIGNDLLFRAQRVLSLPYDFAVLPFMVEKWIFVVMMAMRFLVRAAIVTVLAVGVMIGFTDLNRESVTPTAALQEVVRSVPYLVILAFVALQHIRLILFRLGDKTRAE